MFESIVIRPSATRSHPLDIGQVVENLFFYQKTNLHIGPGELSKLIEYIDIDSLSVLLKRPELDISMNNSPTGVFIFERTPSNSYTVDIIRKKPFDIEKTLYNTYQKYSGDTDRSKDFSQKIAPLIKIYELPESFSAVLDSEIKDSILRKEVALEIIKYYNPEYIFPVDPFFEVNYTSDTEFKIESNIDFSGLRIKEYDIILMLINALEDIQVIAEYQSEISIPEINSLVVRTKVSDLVRRSTKSKGKIEAFNNYIYDDSIQLREVINRKEKSVKEFLPILEKATKYKDWIRNLPDDKNLLREYIKKVGEKNWIESLPAKAIRFYLAAAIGFILKAALPIEVGLASGVALNAFNSFVLDKLIANWKPNQFIEKELLSVVRNDNVDS